MASKIIWTFRPPRLNLKPFSQVTGVVAPTLEPKKGGHERSDQLDVARLGQSSERSPGTVLSGVGRIISKGPGCHGARVLRGVRGKAERESRARCRCAVLPVLSHPYRQTRDPRRGR